MHNKGTTLKTRFLKSAGVAGAMAVALTSLAAPAMADDRPRSNTRPEVNGREGRSAPQPRPAPQVQARPQMQQQARPQQRPSWSG